MGEGVEVAHHFEKPGTYPVTLTVTDPTGSACDAGTATLSVFVDAPPVADAGLRHALGAAGMEHVARRYDAPAFRATVSLVLNRLG